MSTDPKRILITGATGNQGTAVINALLASPLTQEPLQILALTRNTDSPKAKALVAKSSSVHLIKGDFDDCNAIFEAAPGPVWGVYSVQVNVYGPPPEKVREEETQGYAMIDAAVKYGVRHFVQASGDRGGPEKSAVDPTSVPQFATKFNIERYLMQKAEEVGGKMSWTILRPTSFMENCTPDMHGRGFAAMWSNISSKRLQLISTRDIGVFAAKAFEQPHSPPFHNAAVSLAGDELTQDEACKVFQKVFGRRMPMMPEFVGSVVQWRNPDLRSMFDWYRVVGFGASVEECRGLYPGLQGFETWLRETSEYGK